MNTPTSLTSATFSLREFLTDDVTDTSLVAGYVDTQESEDDLLMIESVFSLGDGQKIVEFDLSTMVAIDSPEGRLEAAQSLEAAIKKMKAIQDAVSQHTVALVDACLEAITVVESYGDAR